MWSREEISLKWSCSSGRSSLLCAIQTRSRDLLRVRAPRMNGQWLEIILCTKRYPNKHSAHAYIYTLYRVHNHFVFILDKEIICPPHTLLMGERKKPGGYHRLKPDFCVIIIILVYYIWLFFNRLNKRQQRNACITGKLFCMPWRSAVFYHIIFSRWVRNVH